MYELIRTVTKRHALGGVVLFIWVPPCCYSNCVTTTQAEFPVAFIVTDYHAVSVAFTHWLLKMKRTVHRSVRCSAQLGYFVAMPSMGWVVMQSLRFGYNGWEMSCQGNNPRWSQMGRECWRSHSFFCSLGLVGLLHVLHKGSLQQAAAAAADALMSAQPWLCFLRFLHAVIY